MFKEGLKNLTVAELSEETGIKRQRIYNYIHQATPSEYKFGRDEQTGAGEPPYLLTEEDIELLAIIHELAQTHSIKEVKQMLKETDTDEKETIVEEVDLVEVKKEKELIVPQVLANFAEQYKTEKTKITQTLLTPQTEEEKMLSMYMFNHKLGDEETYRRQDLLFEVLVNGYDGVEESLYRVIFEDNDAGFFLYKADDVSVTISNDLDNYEDYEGRLLLTEKEIENYDSRFMVYAHPEL